MSDVKFIRKNGRIIPIRSKGEKSAHGQQKKPAIVGLRITNKSVSAKERFQSGFSAVGKIGAAIGGILGAGTGFMQGISTRGATIGKELLAGAKGAGIGGAAGAVAGGIGYGLFGGVVNTLIGSRKQTTIAIGIKKKKK